MANDGTGRWERQARNAAARVEEDLRRVVAYINDAVVPEIRANGSKALRIAAEELQKLAERMDDHRRSAAHAEPSQGPPDHRGPGPEDDRKQP